jgi:ankyrin repeat protein
VSNPFCLEALESPRHSRLELSLRFQYVAHQFEALRDLSSVVLVRKALSELPVGLDDTYARLLEAINPKLESQVASTLKWLAFSSTDFPVEELAEIFILRPDRNPVLDQDERLINPRDVLKHLSGLVLEYGTLGESRLRDFKVRLAHFSIREYLVSDRITGPAARFACSETEAHLHIARSCLAYHLQYDSMVARDRDASRWGHFYLEEYTASSWPVHLEMVPRELWPPDIVDAAARALAACSPSLDRMFPRERGKREILTSPYDTFGGHWKESWAHVMRRIPHCFTARFGFAQLTDMLIASREYPTQEDLDQALIAAAYGGHIAVVNLLLDRGAHAAARVKSRGSALLAATVGRHTTIVERLLDRGADADAQFDDVVATYTSALQAACEGRRTRIIELLVERGANVNLPGVLTTAIVDYYDPHDALTALKLLCDSGADIDIMDDGRKHDYGTPLHTAAMCGRSQAFDFLLQRGANVNARGGKYGYPLQALCSRGKYGGDDGTLAQVELLLARGADINARGGKYGSALQCAFHHHSKGSRLVLFLLDRGADAHARGGLLDTTLQAACTAKCTEDIVPLLLDMQVDVHAQGGFYGNALQAACYHDRPAVAKRLLDLGVDINTSGGEYGSALQAAAASRRDVYRDGDDEDDGKEEGERLVLLLLQRGADVNQRGGRHGTALQAAVLSEKASVVRLLLKHGADIDSQGGEYGTALQAAAHMARANWDMVHLLLEHGADINIEGGECHSVLQAACHTFYRRVDASVALLLLERGANVHARGGKWGSAWHAAAAQEDSEWEAVLQGMLDRGVNINDTGGPVHPTALQATLESQKWWGRCDERIRFLLDRGADVNIRAGKYGFPLQSACCSYRHDATDIVEFLLTDCPGIDVNAQGGMFGSALQAAAYHGRARMVEMLLDHGAHVNPPRGGKCGSPLNAAVIGGYWNIVKVLLAAGAAPDCHLLPEPDEEWLAQIGEEHGRGAAERYRVFWDRHKAEYGLGNNLGE